MQVLFRAAGGDMGAALGPQLIGIITDSAMKNDFVMSVADSLSITAEQPGMKIGVAIAMLFPPAAVFVFVKIKKLSK